METYYGHVRTLHDALLITEACYQQRLSRVMHRLSAQDRSLVRSGTVFVWDEGETGMCRWTDGRFWSPSRNVSGFLTYRELARRLPRLGNESGSRGTGNRREFEYLEDGLVKRALFLR